MQSHLLEAALNVITNPQVLVNVISRRVKQLSAGHRALVVVDSPRMGFCDIALTEVIHRKLTYEMIANPPIGAVLPKILNIAAFAPEVVAADPLAGR